MVVSLAILFPAVSGSAATSVHDRGILRGTDSGRHTLTVQDTNGDSSVRGHTVTLAVTRATRISRDGKTVRQGALQAGDGIDVIAQRTAGKLIATTVAATSPPRPDGPAASAPGECVYYGICTPALPPATDGPTLSITISNDTFDPPVSIVPVDTIVTVRNTDSVTHTFSGNHLESGPLSGANTFSVEFTTPGTYRFFCNIHAFMQGTLEVR